MEVDVVAPKRMCPDHVSGPSSFAGEGVGDPQRLRVVPVRRNGAVVGRQWTPLLDIRATPIFNSDLLLSRKRSRNLGDLMSVWRKLILEKFIEDEDPFDEFLSGPQE
jgi:hypothetical protein